MANARNSSSSPIGATIAPATRLSANPTGSPVGGSGLTGVTGKSWYEDGRDQDRRDDDRRPPTARRSPARRCARRSEPPHAHLGPATAPRCRRRAAGSARRRRAPGATTDASRPTGPSTAIPTSVSGIAEDEHGEQRHGTEAAKTRKGDGPGVRVRRRACGARCPATPAPATSPIDSSDQPDDEQDRGGRRPAGEQRDDDRPEADERRQPADDEQRRARRGPRW